MVEGRKEKIDFRKYESPNLNLNWSSKQERSCYNSKSESASCATSAIMLITKKSRYAIEKLCVKKDEMFTTRIIYILKQFGYTVKILSKNNVTNTGSYHYPITRNHLLVMNVKVDSEDNSCYVLHNSKLWHNGMCEELNPLFTINKPTQDVLLVWHPSWEWKY